MPTPSSSLLEFLETHRTWGGLSQTERELIANEAHVCSFRTGDAIALAGQWDDALFIILDGKVRASYNTQNLTLTQGEQFGAGLTKKEDRDVFILHADADAKLLKLSLPLLSHLLETTPLLRWHLPVALKRNHAIPEAAQSSELLNMQLSEFVKRAPISIPLETDIQTAARMMREHGVSSLLLMEDKQLHGVLTDRDMRNRVVAENLPLNTPVTQVATFKPFTLDQNRPAFEALLLMARHNIHHIPVMNGATPAGMITTTDLTRHHGTSAVYLARDIQRQTTLEGLVTVSQRIHLLQRHLAAANTNGPTTAQVITTITDAFTSKLIQLAHNTLGPAPIPYAWIAAGSQARQEQTAKSDQDNCMILDDSYDPLLHGDYFKAFATQVCEGLAACGYILCPGDMMAMNDKWRQPLRQWREYFQYWVRQPDPMALMLTSVFFDMRATDGAIELMDELRKEMLNDTRGNTLFLAHMVVNAQKLRPPLGLFGNISVIRSGEHAGTVDLKHTALAPMVDLGRIYALSSGLPEVNTLERIQQAAIHGSLSEQGAQDLQDAYKFIATLRVKHQTDLMQQGRHADNYLDLHELSHLERSHLKDAFGVIQSLQTVLSQRYHF